MFPEVKTKQNLLGRRKAHAPKGSSDAWGLARLVFFAAAVLLSAAGATKALAQAKPATSTQRPFYAESLQEYERMKAAAKGGVKHTYATQPDWRGIWRTVQRPRTVVDERQLTPKYQADLDRTMALDAKGIEWDRMSWCLPNGMPRWLTDPFMREFIVTPEQTWLLAEQINETRRIYTDGRAHTLDSVAIPLWHGDSIGFWDQDTLVIHTTHLKAGHYGRNTAAYSFKTSTLERWRKIDPQTIKVDLTVYDPESLRRPWRTEVFYGKVTDPDTRVRYNACEEGNNSMMTPEGGTDYILPGDPGYRDPATFGIPKVALDSLPQ
jgi:hypothetical protein